MYLLRVRRLFAGPLVKCLSVCLHTGLLLKCLSVCLLTGPLLKCLSVCLLTGPLFKCLSVCLHTGLLFKCLSVCLQIWQLRRDQLAFPVTSSSYQITLRYTARGSARGGAVLLFTAVRRELNTDTNTADPLADRTA